jgi:hypothetical protein
MSIETLDSSVQRTSLGGHLVNNYPKKPQPNRLGKRFQLNACS